MLCHTPLPQGDPRVTSPHSTVSKNNGHVGTAQPKALWRPNPIVPRRPSKEQPIALGRPTAP